VWAARITLSRGISQLPFELIPLSFGKVGLLQLVLEICLLNQFRVKGILCIGQFILSLVELCGHRIKSGLGNVICLGIRSITGRNQN
jgi:hypothetical protein